MSTYNKTVDRDNAVVLMESRTMPSPLLGLYCSAGNGQSLVAGSTMQATKQALRVGSFGWVAKKGLSESSHWF